MVGGATPTFLVPSTNPGKERDGASQENHEPDDEETAGRSSASQPPVTDAEDGYVMATQPVSTPGKHGKAPLTGKGSVVKAPASGASGPSNHIPKIGKPTPGEPGNLSNEQQQQ
jgi:hypothetical protein